SPPARASLVSGGRDAGRRDSRRRRDRDERPCMKAGGDMTVRVRRIALAWLGCALLGALVAGCDAGRPATTAAPPAATASRAGPHVTLRLPLDQVPGLVEGMTFGSDHNLWLTAAAVCDLGCGADVPDTSAIVRVSPEGAAAIFPLPHPDALPMGIAPGP